MHLYVYLELPCQGKWWGKQETFFQVLYTKQTKCSKKIKMVKWITRILQKRFCFAWLMWIKLAYRQRSDYGWIKWWICEIINRAPLQTVQKWKWWQISVQHNIWGKRKTDGKQRQNLTASEISFISRVATFQMWGFDSSLFFISL